MCAKILGHTEASDTVLAEDFGHLLVRGEKPFVRVLEVFLLEVGPQMFDALSAAGLGYTNDGLKIIADLKKKFSKYYGFKTRFKVVSTSSGAGGR